MSPGHDTAMFHPHGQGRHHIASSGHKQTCLFWLVQRIVNPLTPHLQLQIYWASTLFKQIRVTGCSCQCHHLPEWDHVSSIHPLSSSLTWAEVWECWAETLPELKGQGGRPPCRPGDEPLQILSFGKSKETVMLMSNQKGLHVYLLLTSSWFMRARTEDSPTENGKFITFSASPSAQTNSFAQLHFMSNERCHN